ncbi:hypothetical protein Godav_012169 [Gossypium davidsonii]|uniref:RNase H type-1 domain-containing protein n=1 Tax=Gossypium davidsonii TaxID=34287 RepID=A0A7J8RCH9_GOSDV|nr:hypothetical protein [Gossypium davidsonii]
MHAFFDHYLIAIDLGDNRRDRSARDKEWFKFNANWIIEESCEQQVKNFWEANSNEIFVKLEKLGVVLKKEMGRIYVGTRPSKGEVKLACTYPNEHVANPTTTEARVYLQDLTVAEDLGFRKLVVEGHSLTIVKKAQSVNRTAHAMVEEGRELSSSTYWIEEASVRVEEKAERDRRACCD